jgi:glycosyltransferase involved in cell wall biosynthesis
MKIACVVHRFGAGIAGGSESHCRAVAGHLASRHDVTILTTCATDHITWRNVSPAGVSQDGPVAVQRFPVIRTRSLHRFAEISEVVFSGKGTEAEQAQWFRENGPESPALLDHLARHGHEYDRVLFWAFRYATSFFGVPLVADRAVLVPTAEADPLMRLDVLAGFFALPAGFVFLTPEERELVARRAATPLAPSCVIGCGLDPVAASPAASVVRWDFASPFVLYLGRVDPNKGCETLVRHFLRHHRDTGSSVPLVMAGPANMPIPNDPSVRPLGYVDDAWRTALLSRATALIVPSPYESLSMVLLEAWNHAVPALVNGGCDVLKGQVLRSNGGLYYRSFDEFARGLDFLCTHDEAARRLGQQGRDYVEREYRWPHVIGVLDRFLTEYGGRKVPG